MDSALCADDSERTGNWSGDDLADVVGRILCRPVGDLLAAGQGDDQALISEESGVLVRVGTGAEDAAQVLRRVERTRALAERGAPLLTPLGVEMVGGTVVSVWPLCSEIERGGEGHLGRALRALHGVDTSGVGLPRFDVRSRIVDGLLGVADLVPRRVHEELTRRGLQAVMAMDDPLYRDEKVALHGGGGSDSIQRSPTGEIVLTPPSGAFSGPRCVDVIPTYVRYTRFHRDRSRWDDFSAEYGTGDMDLAVIERFRGMWESLLNIELAREWDNPGAQVEIEHRLATLDADWWSHSPWREF